MFDSTHQGLVGRAGLTTPTDEGALEPRTGSAWKEEGTCMSKKSPTPLTVQTVDHMFLTDLELTLFAQVTHSLTVILR